MKQRTLSIFILVFSLISLIPAFSAELLIKPGNIVHITVLGYPELSQSVLVRKDGATDYPLLANVPIDGMTIHQLQEVLQPILARFVERPKVFISIAEHVQLEITIEGQVKNPGTFTLKGPINLQGVLSLAGGTTQLADLRSININRRDYDQYRTMTIDLYEFFMDPKNNALPAIEDGDIIFVPIISPTSIVRVMGSVRSPGSFIPSKDENIVDMINMAGGATQDANMNRIIFITERDGRRNTEYIQLRTLLNSGQPERIPIVNPGDIIIVTEYEWWQEVSWWASALRDIAVVLSSIVILSRL